MPDYGGPGGFGSDDSVGGNGGGPAGSQGQSGSGDHSGAPGSASAANVGGSGASAADQAALAAAQAAIASGKNPFASSTQQSIAQGLVDQGFFGPDGSNQGILGLIGYDQQKSLPQNIVDMVVPGRNTPLGLLSAVPGIVGASKTVQGIVGLANAIAGKVGQSETQSRSAISDSIVGKDSIIGKLGTPTTGIASGMPDTGYKGDFQ